MPTLRTILTQVLAHVRIENDIDQPPTSPRSSRMSGAEASLVIGLISGIIAIIDAMEKVCDAAKDQQGLPAAFREVAQRLPLVRSILVKANARAERGQIDDEASKAAKSILETCKGKVDKLGGIFQKVVPQEGSSRHDRIYKAVRTLGKGGEVEALMEGVLVDLNLLSIQCGIQTGDHVANLKEAMDAISTLALSVPDHAYQSTDGAATACRKALRLTDPYDDREKVKSAKGKRVPGTCEWIRNDLTYRSWLDGNAPLLFISAGPGKGKTMLSIFLTEELERLSLQMERTMLLFFFCDNQDEKRNTAVAILRGLVYQIVEKRPDLMKRHVLPYFEDAKWQEPASLETLWIIFQKLVLDPDLGTTFCVLDGLDECDDASSRVLIAKLVDFSLQHPQSTDSALRLVIVSRELLGLENCARVKLDPDYEERVASDVEQFISFGIKDLLRIPGFKGEFRTYVQNTLLQRANGTFLWVGFVMNELSQKKTCTEVQETLNTIPQGLPAIYSRMLLQIEESQRSSAIQILHWVTMAVRPLTLQELAAAINVQPSRHLSVEQGIHDRITLCKPFLELHENEVSFVHQSARDYLLRPEADQNPILEEFRIKPQKAHLELARKCLSYISDTSWSEQSLLSNYAVLYWPEHARDCCTHAGELLDVSLPFFQDKSSLRRKWNQSYSKEKRSPPLDLLHAASYFGIVAWVETFLKKKKFSFSNPAKRKDKEYGRTPLSWAAGNGHGAVVKLLLEAKADVDSKDNFGQTPLSWAAESGHEAVVKLLLATGNVDVDSKDIFCQTPLSWAAESGHEAVVKLLLATGNVDVDSKSTSGQTPLSWASKRGHEAVVKLLLATGGGVDVDSEVTG